ncbi:ClpP/crotonase [Hesseltinella vesiculosa]|uniref:ClpP/crotonase n=1 Tax=Hesseltinella vesiculosa TaxID=101127 RepID=A0A1X2GP90_9FUNG|nr:ClpP/crotonase [Hesseltinella vesiculosa]
MALPTFKTLEITVPHPGVAVVCFNRPQRYNSLTPQAYLDWLNAVRYVANDDSLKVCVLTGKGKFYCSGQDLDFSVADEDGIAPEERFANTKNLITEMINFPKLLIAGVNGNSIGFGCTTLGLCDVVYSVPEATFNTPFMQFGFCAEGCSSVLFPRIMGVSKANEMLLLGRRFSAKEMEECNFLRVLPSEGFHDQVIKLAAQASNFSLEALKVTKSLVRGVDRELLHKTNTDEMDRLAERMVSPDSLESIMKFMQQARDKKKAKTNGSL